MKKKLIFYDESFHSRIINDKTIHSENFFINFVSSAILLKHDQYNDFKGKYEKFEEKHKKIYSLNETQELKSEIVKKKRYKDGLVSFDKNSLEMYFDFFSMLLENDVMYFIGVSNKLEYLLLQCSYHLPVNVSFNKFIYSLVKVINVYMPDNVINDLCGSRDSLFLNLINFIIKRIKLNENSMPLKELENNTLKQCLVYLKSMDSSNINYNWDYKFSFYGLSLLLKELNLSIGDVDLLIDQEGNGKTIIAAKEVGFVNACEQDSTEEIGVRCSDMLCGFISRMMFSLNEVTKFHRNDIYKERILIPEDWFKVNKKQFNLYKLISKYLKKYKEYYYASYVSNYFDLFAVFVSLVHSFDEYSTFENFKNHSLDSRKEKANNFIINYIQHLIDRMK